MYDSKSPAKELSVKEWVNLSYEKNLKFINMGCGVLTIDHNLKMFFKRESDDKILIDNFLIKDTVKHGVKGDPGWGFSVIGREGNFKVNLVDFDVTQRLNKFMVSHCKEKAALKMRPANNMAGPSPQMRPANIPAGPSQKKRPANIPAGPSEIKRPANIPAGPFQIKRPANIPAGPSQIKRPANIPAGPSQIKQPANILVGPSQIKRPANIPAGPFQIKRPANILPGPSQIKRPANIPAGPSQQKRPANIPAGPSQRMRPANIPAKPTSGTGCVLCGEAFLKKKQKMDRETKKMVHLTCWEERYCHFCEFSASKLPSVDCTCGHSVHTTCLSQATKQAGGLYIHKEKQDKERNPQLVVGDLMAGTVYKVKSDQIGEIISDNNQLSGAKVPPGTKYLSTDVSFIVRLPLFPCCYFSSHCLLPSISCCCYPLADVTKSLQ